MAKKNCTGIISWALAGLLLLFVCTGCEQGGVTITGAKDLSLRLGDPLLCFQGVEARDAAGNLLELTADTGAVNTCRSGVYELVYTAADEAGRTGSASVQITVAQPDPEALDALAAQMVEELRLDALSKRDKLHRIHIWVNENIRYTKEGEKTSPPEAATCALKLRRGDCYSYYALCELLIRKAGIETIGVERTGPGVEHYWNLVKLDDGWYHFDACPAVLQHREVVFTEGQARAYNLMPGWEDFYVYDAALYPPVVE